MQKTFIVIVALFGLISANSFFRAPTTDFKAVSSRNFTIEAKEGAFLVNADTAKDSQKDFFMLVALYSSQQILNGKTDSACGLTGEYNCKDLGENCKIADAPASKAISSPYLSGTGEEIKPVLIAENWSWKRADNAAAIQTTKCDDANVNKDQFKNAAGVWGLGFEGDAKSNFVNETKNFWVSFPTATSLSITFSDKKDVTVASGVLEKRWSVKSNADWKVDAPKGVTLMDAKEETGVKVIFDVNADNTGFPKAIYDKIVATVAKKAGCEIKTDVLDSPSCDKKIKLADIGELKIVIDDKTSIILHARDIIDGYVIGTEEYAVKLNIRALGSGLTGKNYITKAAEDEKTIIIGSKALRYYVTVFNVEESSVTAYYLNLEAIVKAILGFIKWIIIAIVGSIIVCCLCICFCCGGTAWIVAKLGKKDKQDNYYQSSQTDPFVARK